MAPEPWESRWSESRFIDWDKQWDGSPGAKDGLWVVRMAEAERELERLASTYREALEDVAKELEARAAESEKQSHKRVWSDVERAHLAGGAFAFREAAALLRDPAPTEGEEMGDG